MSSYKHILIADGDNDDIELFQSAISECSFNVKVSTAKDGQMLIEFLEKEPAPDVIVLDLNMPRLNGYDCLKAIRRNRKFNQVPVMVLSTSSSQNDIDYCISNGVNYYAEKP